MNNLSDRRADAVLFAALALAMVATRMDHFGGALALPDASLAVFLLAGLWLRAGVAFFALLATALVVDLAALAQQGLGADCLSPAYPFLAAAYGALWAAGRRLRPRAEAATLAAPAAALGAFVLATTAAALLAFAISNLSWFAFSGHFDSAGLADFVARTLPQAPRYLGAALGYALAGLALRRVLRSPAAATAVGTGTA